MTLARKFTIKKTHEFALVKSKGKKMSSESFTLAYLKRGDQDPPRFGFIISTKVSKHASLRNRAKRALSEATRRNLSYLKNGYDCVFLAKPTIVKKYTSDLMHEVDQAMAAARLLKKV